MSEDQDVFDPMLNKKKKKKKPFSMDNEASENAEIVEEAAQKQPTSQMVDKPADDLEVDGGEMPDLTFDKKKKKKKKQMDISELSASLPREEAQVVEGMEPEEERQVVDDDDTIDFSLKKKKKKKDKGLAEPVADKDDADGTAENVEQGDNDYTYEELLARVFEIMKEKNPDMVAGEKKKFVMKPPNVMRIGTKKTSFSNFVEICKMLHRQPKHLQNFLLAELGTSGSLDINSHLIIKGRFQQKQIENVLRRYIKEYVTCHTCKSPETMLQKDTRIYFLQCETCGSRCSVASIKSGFQAVTGKRAAIRARTA